MQENKVKTRSEIAEKDKWDLGKIYASDSDWEKSYARVKSDLSKIQDFQGRLGEGPLVLADCFKLEDSIEEELSKLYVYAHMRYHEDTGNTKYQALSDKVTNLNVAAAAAFSFIVPEIIALPENTLLGFLAEDTPLKLYDFSLREILRQKKHILSAKEEKLIAEMGELANTPEHAFSLLTNADLKFPEITDEVGNKVALTEERYSKFIHSKDRRVREEAFKALFGTYSKVKNTIGALYSGSVKKDLFYAAARKYASPLEQALDADNIPTAVYDTVVKTINDNLEPLHRYMKLRKKMLGVEELHMYDLYTPLVPELQKDIPYEEGKEIVLEGLGCLGKDYQALLQKAMNERWIDVYENEGKRSGAYSWGTYGTQPYILLNYGNTFQDVFTLAHELGHSMHSYLSWQNQPYPYASYTIFLAEVASTTNEALLMHHLLKKTADPTEKLYLLNHYLEKIRTTVYRQTMFAEFEKIAHEKAKMGEALTPEMLSAVWHEINERYYGPEMLVDKLVDIEWARIPHFYSAFYVYKYVTGYAAATSLSVKILNEGEKAVKEYLRFLSRGSSAYSLDILRDAGVDMTSAQPLLETVQVFNGILAEMEELMLKLKK